MIFRPLESFYLSIDRHDHYEKRLKRARGKKQRRKCTQKEIIRSQLTMIIIRFIVCFGILSPIAPLMGLQVTKAREAQVKQSEAFSMLKPNSPIIHSVTWPNGRRAGVKSK